MCNYVVFFIVIHIFSLLIDNELCIRTPNLLVQAEFCHFSQEFSDSCAAPFSRFLCNQPDDIEHFTLDFTQCANRHINQTHNLCTCGYRGGRRECIPCELHNGRTTHVIHMHTCTHEHMHPHNIRTHTHTSTNTHAHMNICTHTTYGHTHTHKHKHTCTHISTPTYKCMNPLSFSFQLAQTLELIQPLSFTV